MKLLHTITNFFKRSPKAPDREPRIITMEHHSGWGDSIYFWDFKKRRVTGHMTPKPEKGDILRCMMDSGRVARFEFVEIKHSNSVHDLFWATMKDLNYEE